MQVSYSRIECFNQCPFKYKLRYIDKLKTLPNQDATNALYLGTALHVGLEHDIESAIQSYRSNYYILTDLNINEEIKLEYLISKTKVLLPDGDCEVKLESDDFIGYIDRLCYLYTDSSNVKHYSLYDYKYSNNKERYLQSKQLHVYKWKFEELNPKCKIDHLYYVMIGKCGIRQKKTETIQQFRQRILNEIEKLQIEIIEVLFNENIIAQFLNERKRIESATEYPKCVSKLCDYCDYYNYCMKGEDWFIYED